MVKQTGHMIITGNIEDLAFYRMDGKGSARSKSSFTGKQFGTKACFANSRRSSERFARSNKSASEVYNTIPAAKRGYSLFTKLRYEVIALLKADLSENEMKTQTAHLISSAEN